MGRGPKWTAQDERILIQMRRAGASHLECAEALDRTAKSVSNKLIDLGKTEYRHHNFGITQDPAVRRMATEWRGKKSASKIAEMCGVTRNAIIGHWRREFRGGVK